jgi:MSHA pilin protein MshD
MTRGFTLIELMLAITIIAIAVIGVLSVINMASSFSADPMITHQAVAIGESYLQEITTKPFPTTALPCSGSPPALRSNYSTICDYKGIPVGGQVPTDVNGNAIAGLSAYTVQVTIDDTTANVNGLTAAANRALRIDVTVSHPNMTTLIFSAYRTRY